MHDQMVHQAFRLWSMRSELWEALHAARKGNKAITQRCDMRCQLVIVQTYEPDSIDGWE